MKKAFLLAALSITLLNNCLLAQTADPYKITLPSFIPATPEATAFVKAGVGSTNMSTGAATASIPLYTIKIKDFSFPISISYSTQGLKADEASSRVGHGWVLTANGMITRSVKGAPDELATRLAVPAAFDDTSDAFFQYLQQASSSGTGSGKDTQPDEFQFHCNGLAGKFLLDNSNVPRITSASNVRIQYAGPVITITDTNGVIYTFGNTSEVTTSHSFGQFTAYPVIKTAYFLDNIALPTGETIVFHYLPISTKSKTSPTQTYQVLQSTSQGGTIPCAQTNLNKYTTSNDVVNYSTNYLSSITTSTGLTISLSYEARPDASGDNRLTTLDVAGLKTYSFFYSNVNNPSNQITGRYFLTKVSDVTLSSQPSLDYVFSYQQLSSVPLPITFQQDYLGFYNASPATYFISNNILAGQTVDYSLWNPSSGPAMLGTLTQIRYPTGGTQTFTYEGNTMSQSVLRNTFQNYQLSGPGGGSSGSFQSASYTNNSITVPFSQSVTLVGIADPSDTDTEDSTHHTISVYVKENGNTVTSFSLVGFGSSTHTVTLQAGHTYQLQMDVMDYTVTGTASLTYNTSAVPIYDDVNVSIPGVRLKQLTSSDPVTGSTYSKYYTYAAMGNLGKSTGGVVNLGAESGNLIKSYCSGAIIGESDYAVTVYSSSAIGQSQGYAGSGSVIYYNKVIESDSPSFSNGGTEYTFFANDDGLNQNPVLGSSIPYIPGGQYPTLSGILSTKVVFDNSFQTVRAEQYLYETQIDMTNSVPSIYVRQNWDPTPIAYDSRMTFLRMAAFDAVRSDYANYWNRLYRKVVTELGTFATQTDYLYGGLSNILPSATVMRDSKGSVDSIITRYPNTYIPEGGFDNHTSGYSMLASRNILNPEVHIASYHNGVLQQQKKLFYIDWFNNLQVIAPQSIEVQESSSDVIHVAMSYGKYTSDGSPMQFQKTNDVMESYLWDTTLEVPIAAVKNATADQVAYTSFENGATGNWIPGGGGTYSSITNFTGLKSFSGTLTKAISAGGTYLVSLWTTGTGVTVNTATGTSIRSSNGWSLYQWTLTNPSSVAIDSHGSYVDEVRLAPTGAQMQTFTYQPFVGITTKADQNNVVTYFNYDALGRLTTIRDFNNNILKEYEYQYQH